ncbi:MAG: helicase-related protein [Candidatus Methanofastidiosia archaeon]
MEQLKLDDYIVPERGFVSHPVIKPRTVRERAFQMDIAEKAKKENTLVVIPTGLGKTVIAVLVAADVMKRGKIVMLAPTRPLVLQHQRSFDDMLFMESSTVLTGKTVPEKRKDLWKDNQFIFSTPQVIRNDVHNNLYTLEDTALIIFDEAHRAVGDYAYVEIAQSYVSQREAPLILGLTASPGSQKAKIKEVMENLSIQNVEARVRQDEDVINYVKDIKIEWHKVELTPEMEALRRKLERLLYEKIKKLNNVGLLTYKKKEYISKKDLLDLRGYIPRYLTGYRSKYRFAAYLNQAMAISLYHCLELLETQGVYPLRDYLKRMIEGPCEKRSEKILVNDERVQELYQQVQACSEISHPKLRALRAVLENQLSTKKASLIIVFAQYRDTISSILDEVRTILHAKPVRFVGQSSRTDKGLKQEEQKEILEEFRKGEHNILVASSVAEEGLDIPAVDLVVFYEPIPSEIRSIQRRGRTGRSEVGKVVILITKDSRDEAYLWAERSREKKMQRIVQWLRSQ